MNIKIVMQRRLLSFVMFAAMLFGAAGMVSGQVAHTFTGSSLTYNQNFDGMGATGTAYPTGWTGQRAAGSGTNGALLNPIATDGSAFSGAVYNVGAAGSSDRALATLASGSTAPAMGAAFVNGTGSTITSLNIAGFLEQWRSASRADINEVVAFSYSFNATDVYSPTANWVSDSTLDLNEILISSTTAAAVNGNDSANRMAIAGTLALNWAAGDTLWIRWVDSDNPGSDGMYGLDDLVITAATGAASTTSIVTFSVDMQYQTVSPNGVHIAGNFQGWNPAGTPMVQSTTNPSVYTYSATFPIGDTLQFKFVNGNSWGSDESVPGACTLPGTNNRFVVVAAGNPVLPAVCFGACAPCAPLRTVTFRVNMTNQTVTSGVYIAGTMNNWNQSADSMTLTSNGIYEKTFSFQEGATVQYKFLNGPNFTGAEAVPAACGVSDGFGGFNRQHTVGTANEVLPALAFGTCLPLTGGPTFPIRTIASLRGVDSTGTADSLGAQVAVFGTVVSHNIRLNGMQYVINDGTGGITVYRATGNYGLGQLSLGDSIWAQGTVSQFNGLTQIALDSAQLLAPSRPVPAPTVVSTLDESTENELVRLNGLELVSGTWPAAGSTSSGTNITVREAANPANTFTVRVVANSTDLAGNPPTTPTFDLIGVGGQFDNTVPRTSGYQLFPRQAADVIAVQPPSLVTFRVDIDTLTPGAGGVRVAGNFQGWNPAGPNSAMTQVGSSSIYELSVALPVGNNVEYKFLTDSVWSAAENVPAACGVGNPANRALTVPAADTSLPAIVFGTCNITVPPVPFYSINQINGVDSNGVADSLGLRVRVSGTLYGINQSTNGIQFVMIDGTAGVTIRSASNTFGITNAAEGDSLVVEGMVSQFRGLLQIAVDTAWRVSTGATLKQPTLVTDVNESTENDLIRVNNLTIVSGSWPTAAGQSRNITVTNGTATFTMRILGGTNIGGTTPPTGFFDLIGLGAQFSSSSTGPFTDGYQVFPRSSSDIIPVIVTTPTVNFTRPDTAVTNQTGAINMAMSILNPVSTPAQIKIRYNNSPGANYGSTWETFPPRVGDTITVNVAANATTANFSVLLFNTVPAGRNDTINFTIAAATGGLQPGAINSARIRVSNPPAAPISNATIGQIRGANTNGIADSVGVNVRTTGVVLGFNKRAAGLEFTIFDRTSDAGVGVFRASGNLGYNVTEGDSIRVIGTVSHFNGLSQINPDSIVFISANNGLAAPQVVTAMGENTESRLIRINNLTVVDPTQWPVAGTTGSGRTVVVNDGTNNFDLRIPAGVDVFGTPVPVGVFDLIGIGGQFFPGNPHTGGYQILPRYLADIVTGGAVQDSLTDFALLSPANNATLRVEGPGSTSVDITWEATSFTGGPANITYSWLVDLPTGDFSSPLATIPSNNAGADTALTLNFTQIAALLTANNIPIGGSATLKWTVVANRDMGAEMKMAVMPFNITLERGIISSVATLNPLDGMKLYPNPATDRAYLSYALPKASDLQVEVLNTIGKRVKIDLIHFSEAGVHEIDIAGLPEGIYFVRLSNAEYSAVRRLVVKR